MVSTELLREHPESLLRIKCEKHLVIDQGYLAHSKGYSSRIRKVEEGGKTKWFHTMKQKVSNRVVEIEKKLDDRDGEDLWEYCVGKFKKDRYVFPHQSFDWELDIFRHDSQVYFLLAEVEVPEGTARPKSKPDFLKPHVIYEVPLSDDRFSNKRLGDLAYARSLYTKFSEVK